MLSAAIKVLVDHIMARCSPSFLAMTKVNWSTVADVGDSSPFVAPLASAQLSFVHSWFGSTVADTLQHLGVSFTKKFHGSDQYCRHCFSISFVTDWHLRSCHSLWQPSLSEFRALDRVVNLVDLTDTCTTFRLTGVNVSAKLVPNNCC